MSPAARALAGPRARGARARARAASQQGAPADGNSIPHAIRDSKRRSGRNRVRISSAIGDSRLIAQRQAQFHTNLCLCNNQYSLYSCISCTYYGSGTQLFLPMHERNF